MEVDADAAETEGTLMDLKERNEIYERAIEKWGWPCQMDQLVEELCELGAKVIRFTHRPWRGVLENELADEVADVMIMLEQLDLIMVRECKDREWATRVLKAYDRKLKMLVKMLEE